MRVKTLSSYRIRKATKQFKDVFGRKPTDIEFVSVIGTEEAQFKVTDGEDTIYVLFHENTLMSYSDWRFEE